MADNVTPKATGEYATVIGPDARFKGELTFTGGVRIDGHFEGSIETQGKVLVSEGGELRAEVKATSVTLEGRLVGNLAAQDRVELKASARMEGDVRAAKLLVVEGATFVGRCEVGPDVKSTIERAGKNGNAVEGMRPVAAGAARK